MSVFEYAGEAATVQDDISRRVQISTRNKNYPTARTKAWTIYKLLDKPDNRTITVNGRRCWFRALQTPFKLEIDATGRVVFAFNLEVRTSKD